MEEESLPTFPYPLRASEFVRSEALFKRGAKLELSEEEQQKVKDLDKELFEELHPIKDKDVGDHSVYPGAFLTPEGSRLFSALYLDRGVLVNVSNLAKERGFDISKKDVGRTVFDAFFDDILSTVSSDEDYQKYLNEGVSFPNLSSVLGGETVILRGNQNTRSIGTEDEVKKVFYEVTLEEMPKRVRERLNLYSSKWAEKEFKKAFLAAHGDVGKIQNPERIERIVNPGVLYEKLAGLTKLKTEIKKIEASLGTTNLDEARKILCGLYRRYLNVAIANSRPLVRLILDSPNQSEQEKEILLKFFKYSAGKTPDKVSRMVEKVDHFFKGVGIEIDKNGLYESIPKKLSEYAEERNIEAVQEKTDIYKKYNEIKVSGEQAGKICQFIVDYYGLSQGENPWKVVVYERRGGLAVEYDKSKNIREVRIPKKLNSGLAGFLGTAAHEIEGHVLRYVNKIESFKGSLKIVEELNTGRSNILSEASAMYLEGETVREISQQERKARPYYYVVLQEKRNGGSFKECFKASFAARARREYGISPEEALENPETFEKLFDDTYSPTLRIFRSHTPLSDTSGYLPDSEQLDYIEQELVVGMLTSEKAKQIGFSKLLYVAGIDLYSIRDLMKLGALSLDKIKEPEMLVARYIWPRLKTSLDAGMSLEQAISKLSSAD